MRNAAALADSPRIERFDIRMLTSEEAKQLLAAAEHDRLAALYSVALALGLRQGEALGLSWSDVDLDAVPYLRFAAGLTLDAHLDKLSAEGRLRERISRLR